jgi:N-acetylated-alpha-linked acidic dipeptidase
MPMTGRKALNGATLYERCLRGALRAGMLALAALLPVLSAAAASQPPLPHFFGFTPQQSLSEQALERRFDADIDPGQLREWLRSLSAEANHVGSPHNKANAERVRDLFKQWGWDAQIETFEVLYPTLRDHELELVGPTRFVARLEEPAIAGDATSARKDGLPAYNEYGGDGDVTGDLVYVNYGMPDDYKELARRQIDVRGKIVIARYFGGWRGLKPKLAQEHGAVGCIIYSDPQDDGYGAGDVYPRGGFRPAEGLQRGSVLDMPLYPGDPLTPGVGATQAAKRLSVGEAPTILKIPVLPISYGDAQPLLAALAGPVAPGPWRGALPITYHMGPGPARVHLAIHSDWGRKTLYDVIAKIPGAESPDEWVIRGNHRDGWVFGAWDPLSGHVAMMAEAKAIGALLQSGWRPRRTLVYASWDGEEAGLLGSTEWVETHATELQRKAVLYVNSDTNSRGFLSPAGSHSLQRLLNDVGASVRDPETGVSALARLRAKEMVDGFDKSATPEQKKTAKIAAGGGDLTLEALGSGSDFTPFLQHLGIASLAIEYGGEEDEIGVYHSNYDTFEHYVRFGDPQFAYGVAEAQTVGHTVLRMADAEVLPFQFAGLATAVGGYVEELHQLTGQKREYAVELGQLLDQRAFALADDPTRPLLSPPREPPVPYLDLVPLDNAVVRLKASAQAYDELYAQLDSEGIELSPQRRLQVNALLQGMEQSLTVAAGLPGREWFKHMIYAPGALTGYDVKTLPAVREAIEANGFDQANAYAVITAGALNAYSERLERVAGLLRPD